MSSRGCVNNAAAGPQEATLKMNEESDTLFCSKRVSGGKQQFPKIFLIFSY